MIPKDVFKSHSKFIPMKKVYVTSPEGNAHMTVERFGLSKLTVLKRINGISVRRRDTR